VPSTRTITGTTAGLFWDQPMALNKPYIPLPYNELEGRDGAIGS